MTISIYTRMQKLQQQNNKNMFVLYLLRYTAWTCENLSSVFANNKGADQTVHPHSLISTYVIHLLECVIPKRNFFSIFYLGSVAEKRFESDTFWRTQKDGFVALRPIYQFSMNSKLTLCYWAIFHASLVVC